MQKVGEEKVGVDLSKHIIFMYEILKTFKVGEDSKCGNQH